jgi:hypothetical protein
VSVTWQAAIIFRHYFPLIVLHAQMFLKCDFRFPPQSRWICTLLGYYAASSGNLLPMQHSLNLQVQICWIYNTACKADRCTVMLKQLTPHTWPLKICYASKFIQIITSLWLVDCTFGNYSEKGWNAKYIISKDVTKIGRCPPCPSHFREVETAKAEETGKAIYLHTGRYNCKWLLLHNFALMRLENLQQFSNWPKIFQLNAI